MDRRREMTLQRISRIGGIADVESVSSNARHKDRVSRAFTIEAALGTYMPKNSEVYSMDYKDTYTSSYGNQGQERRDSLARQMKECETSIEKVRIAQAKAGMVSRRLPGRPGIKKADDVPTDDFGAQLRMDMYRKENGESDFDRLDANRCSGFLLYSYDKNGIHSVLGGQLTQGRNGASGTPGSVFVQQF